MGMIHFDFINPYIVYSFFVLLTAITVRTIFLKGDFIVKQKRVILLIAAVLLIWTQYVRYIDLIFFRDFIPGADLPFYICRLSAVVLLYYVFTLDKRVEGFLFYWGALGLAGIVYPNGPISNISNLTETFYIDHFLLTLSPFFVVVIQGYRPSIKGLISIVGIMAIILLVFIPINEAWNSDYFYLANQSIFGEVFPNQGSVMFIIAHCLAATIFFYGYYSMLKNYDKKVCDNNENRFVY